MGKTSIEWCDFVWNCVRGCSRISRGCENCYAERIAARFSDHGDAFHGFAKRTASGPRWTGRVELIEDKLLEPLHRPSWRGKRVFVNSMSDLFHKELPDEAIDRVFAVMALCPEVTFQVLTKRAERMREYINTEFRSNWIFDAMAALTPDRGVWSWPGWTEAFRNVHLLVSIEDQPTADERISHLLATPAAVRGVSAEPLLGPVDLDAWLDPTGMESCVHCGDDERAYLSSAERELDEHGHFRCPECCAVRTLYGGDPGLDWVITGGESGPGARPAHPDWFRSLRDQCAAAGVPYFFKQHGEFSAIRPARLGSTEWGVIDLDGNYFRETTPWNGKTGASSETGEVYVYRVGKKAAGRLLDGREHNEFPGEGQ